MVALTSNFSLLGSRLLTGVTALFVASLHRPRARKVRALMLLISRHRLLSFFIVCLKAASQPTGIAIGSRKVCISESFMAPDELVH